MNIKEKNKFERKPFLCPECGKTIAVIKGNEIYLKKYDKGEPLYSKIEVNHDSGGQFKVSCDHCGHEHSFATTVKTLGLTYVVAKKKKVVDKSN